MRCRLRSGVLVLGILVSAGTMASPSDVVDGPLIRPAASSRDARDLSGVSFIGI